MPTVVKVSLTVMIKARATMNEALAVMYIALTVMNIVWLLDLCLKYEYTFCNHIVVKCKLEMATCTTTSFAASSKMYSN